MTNRTTSYMVSPELVSVLERSFKALADPKIMLARFRRHNYNVEMTAIEKTTKIFNEKLKNGEIRDDMTAFELAPFWEAELANQRILAQ